MPWLVGVRLVRKLVPTGRVCWCGFQGYRARPPPRPQASLVLRSDGDPPAHGLCREAARGLWEADAAGSRAGRLPRGPGPALTSGTPAPAVAAGTAPSRVTQVRTTKGLILRARCGLGGAPAPTREHLPVHLSHLLPRSDTAANLSAPKASQATGPGRAGPALPSFRGSQTRAATAPVQRASRTGLECSEHASVCGTSAPTECACLLLHAPEGPCTRVRSDGAPGRTTVPEQVVSFRNTKGYRGSKDSLGGANPGPGSTGSRTGRSSATLWLAHAITSACHGELFLPPPRGLVGGPPLVMPPWALPVQRNPLAWCPTCPLQIRAGPRRPPSLPAREHQARPLVGTDAPATLRGASGSTDTQPRAGRRCCKSPVVLTSHPTSHPPPQGGQEQSVRGNPRHASLSALASNGAPCPSHAAVRPSAGGASSGASVPGFRNTQDFNVGDRCGWPTEQNATIPPSWGKGRCNAAVQPLHPPVAFRTRALAGLRAQRSSARW